MPAPHSTNFVPSSSLEPHVSEVVKPSVSEAKSVVVTSPKKITVDFHESKPKASNPPKGNVTPQTPKGPKHERDVSSTCNFFFFPS